MTCYSDKIILGGFNDIEKAVAAKLVRNGRQQIAVADQGANLVSFWDLSNISDQIIHADISDLSITAPLGFAFADLNDDGLQEFMAVLVNQSGKKVKFFQLSDTQFSSLPIPDISTNGDCLDLRFINLSCNLQDILVVPDETVGIKFYQKSDLTFNPVLTTVPLIAAIDGIAFADTDLDGFDDFMAVSNADTDEITFYRFNNPNWNLVYTFPAPATLSLADIDLADFDHDGKLELAVNYDNGPNSEIHFYRMLSDTIWSDIGCTLIQPTDLSGCETVAFGDLTQQGRIDLITANNTEGLVVYKADDIAQPIYNILELFLCNCSIFPLVNVHQVFQNSLFCVDIDQAPVTCINAIFSVGSDGEQISDTEELCSIMRCCSDVEAALICHYGSDVLNRVSDKWNVVYTGPVRSSRVRVDLDNCKLLFEDFYVLCSDGNKLGM